MDISRRKFIKNTAALSTYGLLNQGFCASGMISKNQKHPNLIIVFPDQMRGQALGFLNEDPVITPHLDRFAEESLVLPQVCFQLSYM